MAQQQYEAFLAAGYSYEQALAEGQAALNAAEADYDTMLADQQAYADAVAQQQFEQALAMGYPYDQAVEQGQYALDEAERQYSMQMMENMQVPQIQPEAEMYAAQVGQEQYDLARWMGMPESQAQAQGQYAYDSIEMQVEDDAVYEQEAYVQGYQRFLDTMEAQKAAKQEKMMAYEQLKLQKEFTEKRQAALNREARETQKLSDDHMKRVIAEKRAAAEKKALLEEKHAMKKMEEKRAEEAAYKAELKKMMKEQELREEKMADAKARGRKRAIEELQAKEAEEQAYKKQMELQEAKAKKQMQERMQEEALKELRAQRMERAAEAKRQEEDAAKRRRDAEYAKMMAEYKKQEAVQVTDDGKKEETVMVTPSKPLAVPSAAPVAAKEEPMVTVTSDEGLSHSYPKRDFTPEKPKKEETVTLKTGGEIHDGSGRVADKA